MNLGIEWTLLLFCTYREQIQVVWCMFHFVKIHLHVSAKNEEEIR
jgi:hypothetical protein